MAGGRQSWPMRSPHDRARLTHHGRARTLWSRLTAVTLLLLSACGRDSLGTSDPIIRIAPLPTLLEIVWGDRQRGLSGRALADSIVVRALTPSGAPAAGIGLSWSVTAGTLSTATTTTD